MGRRGRRARVGETTGEPFARYRSIVPDWEAFCAAAQRPLPTCVWTNTLRINPRALAERLQRAGLDPRPLAWELEAFRLGGDGAPGHTPEYLSGLLHVQEEVSLLPGVLLAPPPGSRVLDLCAAPGNKTAQMAVRMGNRGTVVANDTSLRRLGALRHTLQRLGVVCCAVTVHDGARMPLEAGAFDRVLVDAPCSCEATSRKHPWLAGEARRGVHRRLAHTQIALLRRALQLCAVGGRVAYSTCTYAPEENELVVQEALRHVPSGCVRLIPARIPGFRSSPGLGSWQGKELPAELAKAMRVWPHQNDTGGFFVALLEKVGETGPPPQAASAALDLEPEASWAPFLEERFGAPPGTLEGLTVFRANRSTLAVAATGMRLPERPRPRVVGLPFLETEGGVPRLTTPAALLLGRAARRNLVDLSAAQADAFLARRRVALREEQRRATTGPGAVVVAHDGMVLGIGTVVAREGGPLLESDFPVAWAVTSGRSLFSSGAAGLEAGGVSLSQGEGER